MTMSYRWVNEWNARRFYKEEEWSKASSDVSEIWKYISSIRRIILGGNREEETPDPIPNSAVKLFIADGTVRKSTEE